MKIKTKKLYLFAAAFLFLSVFFVKVDGVKNVAKADCYGDYSDCYYNAETDSEVVACENTYDSCYANEGSGDIACGANEYEYGGDCYCDDGYAEDGYGDCVSEANFASCGANEELVNGDCFCVAGYGEDSYGNCTFLDLNTEACQNDSDCVKNIGSGYKCEADSGNCVPDSMFSGKECNDTADCTRIYGSGYVCSGFLVKTCEISNVAAPPTAAEKSTNDSNRLVAESASAAQKNAMNQYNAANAKLASCGGDAARCKAAQDDVDNATLALLNAQEKARAAVEAYNASNMAVNPNSAATGAGFLMCANGILAPVCEGGGGTPYVAGISTGSYGGGSGFSSYGGSYGGTTAPKCGAGFEDIGGVCFPMTTGLSSAPIGLILSNLFSWLMGLFTTFAVLAFVVSGIQYFMSTGDESMAEKAKDNAKAAIVGIIIGLSGFIIVKAVAAALSGQSILF